MTVFLYLKAVVKQNQLIQMGLITLGGYLLSTISTYIYLNIVRPVVGSLHSSITIDNSDRNFSAVVDYLSEKVLVTTAGGLNSIQASTKSKKKSRRDYIMMWLGSENKVIDTFDFRPNANTAAYAMSYKGRTIYLSRSKSEALMGYSETPFTPETLTLSVWGSDNSILKELLNEALSSCYVKEVASTLNLFVQSNSWYAGWELVLSKKGREKQSVILDIDILDVLLNDAKKFLQSGKWYYELGIPYRRGYMLYGPPGCGKTSFVQVLASELKLDLCILNLTHKKLNDNTLAQLFRDAPERAIICLEDVDSVFVERHSVPQSGSKKEGGNDCQVSFSGLLNAIDGIASQEGRIFVMTTNHIERLDAALIRPGRCDVTMELKKASKLQMEQMFLRFFPGETMLATEFADQLPVNELSMAALQGHFLKSHSSPQQCIADAANLLQQNKNVSIAPTKSIYDHLHRVGLERYAAVLEYHGIMTTSELIATDFQVAKLETLSIQFQYDSIARETMTKLLAEDDAFMKESYALAEISTIREAFLAAYPTTYEKQHGEVAPFFRRQLSLRSSNVSTPVLVSTGLNSARASSNGDTNSNNGDGDEDIKPSPMTKMIRSISTDRNSSASKAIVSQHDEMLSIIDEDQLSNEELESLSVKFVDILTKGGKGIISHYNLHQLLESFPHRPFKCVESAAIFAESNETDYSQVQMLAKDLDLYSFLKRAGCAQYLHSINGVTTLTALLEKFHSKSLKEISDSLREECSFETAHAVLLAEILSKSVGVSGSLMRFELHSRVRIIQEFKLFYTARRLHSLQAAADSKPRLAVSPWSTEDIEKLSFSFGVAVTDQKGRAVVSLIEIENHLLRYADDPFGAISSAEKELVNPSMPTVPEVVAVAKPEPTEWVYGWLKEADEALVQYAAQFIDEGLDTRESWLIGDVLSDAVLKDQLNVSIFGHRRKLIAMHKQLKVSV